MNLAELKEKKIETEARISQAVFEVLTEHDLAPETINITLIRNRNLSGDEGVAAVNVEVNFGL